MVRGNSKAPQKSKSAKRSDESSITSKYVPQDVPIKLQQKCLDIFCNAFQPGDAEMETLQKVKGHLYQRDFAAAFGKAEYLQVYASRWSPSRAIGYVQILADIGELLIIGETAKEEGRPPFKVSCLGGGAGAEVVALAGWKHLLPARIIEKVDAEFIDIAAWDNVVDALRRAVTAPPELSKYASDAAKEANAALVPVDQYTCKFHQLDVLQMSDDEMKSLFGDVDLVTLMFTLNELYSTSMAKTQQMLSRLTASLKPGACLLVVDSPGSYSTISINGADKKYPMQWLLDYTLIGGSQDKQKDSGPQWEKLISDDSRWFRLPQGLKYPIELENMRYQIHLYRRLADAGAG